jgi:hypothetical protein
LAEVGSNIEVAQHIQERGSRRRPPHGDRERWIEIAEAIVLAIVAVATAWSGYQAAKWDAQSVRYYHQASRLGVDSQGLTTMAGQDRLYDVTTFNGWLSAKTGGHDELARYYERRFRPEYAKAFAAWQKLDPLNNSSAPPDPILLPEYTNANAAQSETLAHQEEDAFDQGVNAREEGDEYVKITVLLATVLLLTALSQRFHVFGPRAAVVAVAFVLLAASLYSIAMLPRA